MAKRLAYKTESGQLRRIVAGAPNYLSAKVRAGEEGSYAVVSRSRARSAFDRTSAGRAAKKDVKTAKATKAASGKGASAETKRASASSRGGVAKVKKATPARSPVPRGAQRNVTAVSHFAERNELWSK